jgi:DNA-binding transcriptional LysR family regulator
MPSKATVPSINAPRPDLRARVEPADSAAASLAPAAPADLAVFVRAVELGSFSAVARERDCAASQVSRAVDRLEAAYRVRLLRRSTHGLSLTPEGRTLLEHGRSVLGALADLADALAADRGEVSGTVRLALSPALAQRFVVPALPQLVLRHPQLRLEMHAADRVVDLVAEGFDVALRANHLRQQNLVARRVGRYQRAVYASPAYLREHGRPRHPDELAGHVAITHLEAGHLNRWSFQIDGAVATRTVQGTLSANSTWAVMEMVLAGLGVGWLSSVLAEPLQREGRLVELLPAWRDPTWFDIHAVMLPDRDRLPRIRAVVDFLAEALAGD